MSLPLPTQIAVLLPCYNEAASIAKVVAAFKNALPTASIYVYDNNSTDNTAEEALLAGAIVRREPNRGKGNVVRRMFSDIEADIHQSWATVSPPVRASCCNTARYGK